MATENSKAWSNKKLDLIVINILLTLNCAKLLVHNFAGGKCFKIHTRGALLKVVQQKQISNFTVNYKYVFRHFELKLDNESE